MKKIIVLMSLMLMPLSLRADNILFSLGKVDVLVPFSDVSAVYLFDGVAKQSLVGAETPLIQWHKLQLTGGAVSSLQGAGSPFVGVHLVLDNPFKNYVSLAGIQPGVFGGRNFKTNEWIAGIKASVSIFN